MSRLSVRLAIALLLAGVAPQASWAADALSRYSAVPLPSVKLWLALDTQASAVSADTQVLSQQIDSLTAAIASPWPAQRDLPAAGMALGLLAITSPDAAAEVLHPSAALDALSSWPSQHLSRHIQLIRNVQATSADDQLWPLTQPQWLTLRWPMPDAPVGLTELSIDLPLRLTPSRWPSLQLQFADGFIASLPAPQLLTTGRGALASVSLHSAVWAWQQSGHSGQIPPWPWRIQLQAQAPEEQGAWGAWQVASPAQVRVVWDEVSAQRSGREQLFRQLHSLLAGEAVQLPSNAVALQRFAQQLQAESSPCETHRVQDVSVASPDLSTFWSRWRDQALAVAATITRQHSRMVNAQLVGVASDWVQPIAGRGAWPGGSVFSACNTLDVCETQGSPSLNQASVPAAAWLTDVASGQGLQVLAQHWSVFQALHSYWQVRTAPPSVTVLRGRSYYLDTGPSASDVTGRQGLQLWMSSDGSVQAQEANTGAWRWAWRPRESAGRWAALDEDAAVEVSVADSRYAVTENEWALWPSAPALASSEGLDALGQRWLYGLVDGQWVVLDLSQPEQPRSGFLPVISANNAPVHAAQKTRWGSLSLLTLKLSTGLLQPLVLLSAAESTANLKLMLLDGRSGNVLWQAGSVSDAPNTVVNSALTQGWRASWQTLTTSDGSLLAYGVDEQGSVWRLWLQAKPAQSTAIQVRLSRIADLSSPSALFSVTPSLSWLRDERGLRYPALAVAAQATRAPAQISASVFAFLDRMDLAQSGGTLVTASQLPLWSLGTPPPSQASGWQRRLAEHEQVAQAPRWLDQQVLLVTEVPQAGTPSCPRWSWHSKIYRWPWRRTKAGVIQAEAVASLTLRQHAVGEPQLNAQGQLVWLGVNAVESEAAAVAVPVSFRQRVRQRALRAND